MNSAFLRLTTTSDVLVGLLSVLSVFTLVRAHHAPGGGFAGGLLLAAAIAIPLLARGIDAARRTLRVDPRTFIGLGLGLAAAAACIGLFVGAPLLAPIGGPEVPGLVTLGTVMLFDAGVYFLVAGATLTILFAVVERA